MKEKLIELIEEAKEGYLKAAFLLNLEQLCDMPTSEEYLADHLLANGATLQQWIPVSEKLPKCGDRVLITEGNAVFEASLSISHNWIRCGIGWAEGVTHWMPLPEPPKGE